MTDHIKQQVSLFIDDELSGEECEFFVRRLQRDRESRNLYMRYQLIGAAIRGEHINANHATLRSRLQDALERPDNTAALGFGRAFIGGASRIVAGGGIAAGVAAIAVLFFRTGIENPARDEILQVPVAQQRLERVEPPSYVVPIQVPGTPVVAAPEVRLTGLQYLMHHSGQTTSLSRTVVHTNVLAADSEDIVAVAEEATTP